MCWDNILQVEEQPRKLEHVIRAANTCLNIEAPDPSKESFSEQAQDLVFNENVLLQTLGFDVAIDHPHTHVVKTCHLVKGETLEFLRLHQTGKPCQEGTMCAEDWKVSTENFYLGSIIEVVSLSLA